MSTETAKLSVSPETFNIYPTSAPESCVQVTNVSFVPILYRALSTAPKQFQVRPRQGVIESGKSTTIVITYTTKGAEEAAAAGSERKEEFKIEYCRMTPEHDTAIKGSASDSKDIVTDLIKASPKAEKKSKVVTCMIHAGATNSTAATAAAATPASEPKKSAAEAPAASAVSEAGKKESGSASNTATAAHRLSEREATTNVLSGNSETPKDTDGLRSRASATLPSATTTSASSAAATPTPPPPLPQRKKAANNAVSIASDPVAFFKQNPLFIAAAGVIILLLAKLLLF